jgi:predicted Zn-dependent protease
MSQASRGAPPQWLSTHPAGTARIQQIESSLPVVEPLYARADKPHQRYSVPTGAEAPRQKMGDDRTTQ